jgi:hypothetical protein
MPTSASSKAIVTIDGKTAPTKGRFQLPFVVTKKTSAEDEKSVTEVSIRGEERKNKTLSITTRNGNRIQISTHSRKSEYLDFFINSIDNIIVVRGRGNLPVKPEAQFNEEDETWTVEVPGKKLRLDFVGRGQAIYSQDFTFGKTAPQQYDRIFLHKRSPVSSYSESTVLHGWRSKTTQVWSNELGVESKQAPHFTWTYKLDEKGKDAKSRIKIIRGRRNFVGYYPVHRGFPIELSARLTLILPSSEPPMVLGEAASGFWFESLFDWKNYYLSERRWGVYAKMFRSINSFEDNTNISSATFDLKYRFTPGVWNRDETVGAVMGFQAAEYRSAPANMLGVGALWARSMPKVFDDIFNIVPWFRYPKWVDMEGMYYFMTPDSHVELKTNYSITFHGKMFFKPEFFMEAGFGVKGYGFTNNNVNKEIEATVIFGTGGFGYNF